MSEGDGKRCDSSKGIVTNRDSNTIVFHLEAPDPDFLYKLALPLADAVPENTPLEAALPIPATGPYEVASFESGKGVIRLERNQHFRLWSAAAQPDGFADEIVEKYGYTGESAVRAVERGKADITANGPDQTWTPALASSLRTRYSSRLFTTPQPASTVVWLNTRVPPFDDVRVRRALNYAVDRNHLIDLAGGPGTAQIGCQVLPPNTEGYRRYCPYTLHPDRAGTYSAPDLAKAQQLVAASGTEGERGDCLVLRHPGRSFERCVRRIRASPPWLQGTPANRSARWLDLASQSASGRRRVGLRRSGLEQLLRVGFHLPFVLFRSDRER